MTDFNPALPKNHLLLTVLNVFHVLKDTQKFEEKDLLDRCWEAVETETEEAVIGYDGFGKIGRVAMEELKWYYDENF